MEFKVGDEVTIVISSYGKNVKYIYTTIAKVNKTTYKVTYKGLLFNKSDLKVRGDNNFHRRYLTTTVNEQEDKNTRIKYLKFFKEYKFNDLSLQKLTRIYEFIIDNEQINAN